jgi:hypothetical protein
MEMNNPTTVEEIVNRFIPDPAFSSSDSFGTYLKITDRELREVIQSQAEKYEREKREILDFVLNEIEDDMELVEKEIDRLKERDEEGEESSEESSEAEEAGSIGEEEAGSIGEKESGEGEEESGEEVTKLDMIS